MHLLSNFTKKQWRLIGILGIWAIFGSYWYTCNIKYLCKNTRQGVQVQGNVDSTARPTVLGVEVSGDVHGTPAATLATMTPAATWEALVSNPVLVYFATNNDTVITENIDPVLKNIVTYLSENPTQHIVVTGHTNAHKDKRFAVALGLERAQKVKELLISLGAPAQSIIVSSLGDTQLAAPATTLENQALNRRAVISAARNDMFDIKY